MKGFDPALIKWIIFGLVFIVRAVAANNRKRQAKDKALRPPQSAAAPPPIASPTMSQNQPMPRIPPSNAPKKSSSNPDSPWSNNKGPFDS
ncbi:hypothetical protein IAD21_03528 [Abditibacteriota bacterium]|nr:hypothetical protein IAD21_03528 [Abditibacteriota bacterium]